MPSREDYISRRKRFLAGIRDLGPILLVAGGEIPRNYLANTVPYRADSNFLYFFAHPEPRSAALFDPSDDTVTLFLESRTQEDALWHGPRPSFYEARDAHGVDEVLPIEDVASLVQERCKGRTPRTIAVVDPEATSLARSITGEDLDFRDPSKIADPRVIDAIGQLRARKTEDEIDVMRETAAITTEAHIAAMGHTRVGVTEQELVGHVTGTFARHGCVPAYNSILSVRGEVLHNHHYSNVLQDGDTVLLDAGAEHSTGYASDVTRCWPATGQFSPEAADIYDIVLAAEEASIAAVAPGARYRDIHLASCRVIADGLSGLGILLGNVDDLVEAGAHALFFPHGVGHLIGLDVHDMEAFGDAIAYPPERERSEQFGLGYLRLDIDLEPSMCFTIEPGIYFVPGILEDQEFRDKFGELVDWERACSYLRMNDDRGFGGIRIEDDVLCTPDGADVLTSSMPKDRHAVEELVGAAV